MRRASSRDAERGLTGAGRNQSAGVISPPPTQCTTSYIPFHASEGLALRCKQRGRAAGGYEYSLNRGRDLDRSRDLPYTLTAAANQVSKKCALVRDWVLIRVLRPIALLDNG